MIPASLRDARFRAGAWAVYRPREGGPAEPAMRLRTGGPYQDPLDFFRNRHRTDPRGPYLQRAPCRAPTLWVGLTSPKEHAVRLPGANYSVPATTAKPCSTFHHACPQDLACANLPGNRTSEPPFSTS